ncbi:hypothetical protein ABQ078_24265, partial [Xanthomonas hortorum pv. hederae]
RRFIWQLHVFTKEIGFCESFLHVCRLNPMSVALLYLSDVRTGFVGKPRQAGGGVQPTYVQKQLTRLDFIHCISELADILAQQNYTTNAMVGRDLCKKQPTVS